MNYQLLQTKIKSFLNYLNSDKQEAKQQHAERSGDINFYKSWTQERILSMSPEDVAEYITRLWAMRMWGYKQYVVDKLIDDNTLEIFRTQLGELVWGKANIEQRWDKFRSNIKGVGPAMMSEILCKTHPEKYMLWNRKALNGLIQLGVENLPTYDYQITGKKYRELSETVSKIAEELRKANVPDPTLLAVDYFLWEEFPIRLFTKKQDTKEPPKEKVIEEFIHNDVRDAIRDIGQFLGFDASIEKKVADGSKVDAVWESKIGNMGRVIYVFEVQTKGSIDSLLMNLLKALNNPAVQGVVAVSDKKQLEVIRKHAAGVPNLKDRLKCWDYEEILEVHESLEFVNSAINKLNLVPEGF